MDRIPPIALDVEPFALLAACIAATLVAALARAAFAKDGIDGFERRAFRIVFAVMATCVLADAVLVQQMATHGAHRYDMSVSQAAHAVASTPVQSAEAGSEDIDALAGRLVILYRFDCRDCHAVYRDLADAVGGSGQEVLWISSRSPAGAAIVERYSVPSVPTAIRIAADGTAVQRPLDRKNADGKTVLDEEALRAMLANAPDSKEMP